MPKVRGPSCKPRAHWQRTRSLVHVAMMHKAYIQQGPDPEIGAFAVAGAGVEPATYRFSGDRSYQLSYPATTFHVKRQRS